MQNGSKAMALDVLNDISLLYRISVITEDERTYLVRLARNMMSYNEKRYIGMIREQLEKVVAKFHQGTFEHDQILNTITKLGGK